MNTKKIEKAKSANLNKESMDIKPKMIICENYLSRILWKE